MTDKNILTEGEINERLGSLPGWTYGDDKIRKEFKFKDFMAVVDFINKLAPYCEQVDHHPDIHIFYNKVLFELQRFDIGGKVTERDFTVASHIETLFTHYN